MDYSVINEIKQAIQKAIKELRGSFALEIMECGTPDSLYVVRRKSPLNFKKSAGFQPYNHLIYSSGYFSVF